MKKEWITATEVASYAYCPEAWRLEHGLKLRPGNERALAKGVRVHERWQRVERRSAWWIRVAALCLTIAALLWLLG